MLMDIWSGALIALGVACSIKAHSAHMANDSDTRFASAEWQLGAHSALLIALYLAADATVLPAYRWLVANLPEPATQLNDFTAIVLTGAGCLAFVGGLPIAIILILYLARANKQRLGGAT